MGLDPDAVRAALADLQPGAGHEPAAIATRLCALIEAHRRGTEIVELYAAGPWVQLVLEQGDPRYWEIDCLSPNEFRLYPGYERPGYVGWANVWVRDNMDVDELVKTLNDIAFRKDTEDSVNA